MRGRLDLTTRFPVMKVVVDFDNVGFGYMEKWTDITDYVLDVSGSKEKESEVLGGVSSDIVTLTVDNSENKFSVDNPNSLFYKKSKSNLRFALLTGFKGEYLTPYVVGYIHSMQPRWKSKEYLLKATCPMEKLKRADVPEQTFYNVSWDDLVNALLDQAGIEPYFLREIPKTELFYKYFKFEENKCFDALKKLMEVVAGQSFFDGRYFKTITKLAINYTEDRSHKHEITVSDLFEFEEIIDDNSIINKVSIISEPKEIAPLQVVWETPENFVGVQNEQVFYDGTDYVYIDINNRPLFWDDSHEITIKNLTNGIDITWEVYNAELGRIKLTAEGKGYCNPGDLLSVSYTYQYLVLLPGQERKYVAQTDEVIDVFLEPDIVAWNADATEQVEYSSTPDIPNTLSKQSMTVKEDGTIVELVLKNNTSDKVSISTLQFRGYPVRVLNPIEVYNKDKESIEQNDTKEVNITNNYINNIKLAEKLSQFIVENKANIKKELNIQINGYSELLLNDVALVTEEASGTNHLLTIERINFTFGVNSGWTADLTVLEVPTNDWSYDGFLGDSYTSPQKGTPSSTQPYHKGTEPPSDTSLFWVDTSVNPNVTKVYDQASGQWVKANPTTPEEIGAETPQGAQDKADKAKWDAIDYTDTEVAKREMAMFKQPTPPEKPVLNQIWIDTSGEMQIFKRWNGTDWQPIGPVTAGDLDTYTSIEIDNALKTKVGQTEFNEVEERLSLAESSITQNAGEIALRVKQDTYDMDIGNLRSRLSSAESSITQNANEIELKVSQDGVISAINQTAEQIQIEASKINLVGAITLNSFSSELLTDFNSKAEQSYVNQKVNDLQIGGRNLTPNSTGKFLDEETSIPVGWSLWGTAEDLTSSTEDVRGADASVKVTATADQGGVMAPVTEVQRGKVYTISFYVKVDKPALIGYLLKFFDEQGVEIDPIQIESQTLAANEWMHFKQTFIVPMTVATMRATPIVYSTTDVYPVVLTISELKTELGDKATDWSPAPEDVNQQFDWLATRISNAELKIDDDSIISTVTSSITFQNALDTKADASVVGDMATKEEVDEKIGSIDFEGEIDTRLQNLSEDENSVLNLTYATKSELTQTSEAITSKFSATGGMNLIRNSIGYAEFDFWTAIGATRIESFSDPTLDTLGFGHGFKFTPGASASSLSQEMTVIAGQEYTLSWYGNKINNTISGDGRVAVQILNEDGTALHTRWYQHTDLTQGYEPDNFVFIPNSNKVTVRIYCYQDAEFSITGLMCGIGDIALQWSLATGELYNTNVRTDINGIRVSRIEDEEVVGYTNMTPEEFAGYYTDGNGGYEKVFYLNQDETVTKKFKAMTEFTMGSIKVINVKGGGNDGWAFVPTVPEE
ncbi:hypothetical protein DX928_06730 [Bacillus swezeyi]|nr:hypothetical protein DX928_06730 [Bacillus swezeyi]